MGEQEQRQQAGELCPGPFQGYSAPPCLGNSARKNPVPRKDLPILPGEEKMVSFEPSLGKTDLEKGGAEKAWPGLI